MLSGNKGEWSEIYVFLKLLSEGKLYAADRDLNINPNIFYPIIKILREEKGSPREYKINGDIIIIDGTTNAEILRLPVDKFAKMSLRLFRNIKKTQIRSFELPQIEKFLKRISITSLKAISNDKSDIKIVVHDYNTGSKPTLGFSIKSMLGGKSTLFNAGKSTNFIYEIISKKALNIKKINATIETPLIGSILKIIKSQKAKIVFREIESQTLLLNLKLIDSDLPQILSELLLIKYSISGTLLLQTLVSKLEHKNPLKYILTKGHPFYTYKIKNFLSDSALGMTPAKIWKGHYDATGGIIIVKENGEIACYHVFNRNEFQDYLINNTYLDQASMTRFEFGKLYKQNGKIYIKLNLQIRFK